MKKTSHILLLATMAVIACPAQTRVNLQTQSKDVDFSAAPSTKPFKVGTVLPASCNVGEAFFKTNATPGANWYGCVATNTWVAQAGAGGSGGGATSSSQLSDFQTTVTSGTALTVAPGVYRLGNVSYPYSGSTTFTLTQYTIASITQASQATLTLSGNWANSSVHYGDTIYINGAAGAGCSGLNALQTVANLPSPNQVTINWNSTGCAYTANSAQFGANPGAAGTAYVFGDYAGNVTLEMPAAAGLIAVGGGTITPVTIQDSTPGFDPEGVPIASVAIGAAGNGNWGAAADARGFMSTTSLVAGAGMSLNEAGGVWTVGIDRSVVPELGGGNAWTGANDFSAANSTAPVKVTSTAPVACSTGQYYFNSGSGHTYACTATNTWTQVDGGGSGGAAIPLTTNLIKGDGAGNGADSGIAPSSVELIAHKDAASGYAGLDSSGLLKAAEMPNPSASTLGGIKSYSAPAHQWINAISTAGAPSSSQPACGDLSNAAASCSTDTTNASNITSGTLPHARLPTLVSGDIPNNAANTSGAAATATALASSPTLCNSGQAPRGVDTGGNALNCTPYASGAQMTFLNAGANYGASTTYYIDLLSPTQGNFTTGTDLRSRVYMDAAHTVVSATFIDAVRGTLASAGSVAAYIYKNGSVACTITTTASFSSAGPSTPARAVCNFSTAAGDYLQAVVVTPGWSTTPTTVDVVFAITIL